MSLTTVLIRLLCERLEFATYFEILFDSTQKIPDRLFWNFHQICILGQSRCTKGYYSTCMKNFKNQRFGQKSKCFPKCLVFTGRWDSPGGI